MKIELDIDRASLAQRVCQEYEIDIEELTFIPAGEVAYCYIVDCPGGSRYFLKLLSDSRLGRICASGLDFYLPLTRNLHYKGILPNIPYPIKARDGHLETDFGGQPLVLFNFIDGEVIGFENPLPDDILVKLAKLVGILHKSTPEIGIELSRVEHFDIIFEEDLVNGLDALDHITSCDSSGKQGLRDLLLPRKAEILGYLDRLKEFQRIVRGIEKQKVLCHTDLHGGNMIMNDSGELYILDWEGALVAPPEHDLFAFAWEDRFMDVFFRNYEQEFGSTSLDSSVFGFYYYRRNLEDLTDWIVRILYENTDEEQDEHDLKGIAEDCIEDWPYFEITINRIAEKLARV